MSMEVVESLCVQRLPSAGAVQRVPLSQPLRRHLQKIRENLPQFNESTIALPAAATITAPPDGSADSLSIA